jgi:hypothetical protein
MQVHSTPLKYASLRMTGFLMMNVEDRLFQVGTVSSNLERRGLVIYIF